MERYKTKWNTYKSKLQKTLKMSVCARKNVIVCYLRKSLNKTFNQRTCLWKGFFLNTSYGRMQILTNKFIADVFGIVAHT